MFLNKMIEFCKSVNCPSSQALLTFQSGSLPEKSSEKIRRHTEICEFCTAEVEFYSHYPQSEEIVKPEKMPVHLYELAEALLTNQHKDNYLLNQLLNENDAMILREA